MCPLQEASAKMKVGVTTLKKVCRLHGIKRWPYRRRSFIHKLTQQAIAKQSSRQAAVTAERVREASCSLGLAAPALPVSGLPAVPCVACDSGTCVACNSGACAACDRCTCTGCCCCSSRKCRANCTHGHACCLGECLPVALLRWVSMRAARRGCIPQVQASECAAEQPEGRAGWSLAA